MSMNKEKEIICLYILSRCLISFLTRYQTRSNDERLEINDGDD
jgi:hypothetical protein